MIPFDNLDKRNEARAAAIHLLTFPKESEIVPFFRENGLATFGKAPCAWSVYKAQMLEFYFHLMKSRTIAPVRFFVEGTGACEISRDLVRSLLEDCIMREFLDPTIPAEEIE